MRYDAEHKQKTRDKVLKAAAQAIRAEGPDRVGVAAVMAKAGLTHGGFYAHFSSKDELIAAAIGQMFDESRARLVRETQDRAPREGLGAYIDFYLSSGHRDARRSGCPVAALTSDLPRLSDEARETFAAGSRALGERIKELLRAGDFATPGPLSLSVLSELLGALSLARLEPDAARSDRILAASRRSLKQRLGLESRS